MKTGASGASSKSLPKSRSSPRGAGKTKERIRYRSTATCLLLSALPILAQQAAVDPYEDLPDYFPQHYRSLADVPEQYHDGEKLTGCFINESVTWDNIALGPLFGPERIECHNPFYWDEHGRIKRFHYTGDPARKPPSGLPLGSEQREPQPAPCEGCLREAQVLDVVQVYHRELGIEPLGYKTSIVRGYPWNGISTGHCRKYNPNYLDSLHPDPRNPHPNERVNMRRVRRPMMSFNELADICKDSQNRDLTWRVTFQVGWHEPEKRILNEHSQHKRDWPRTASTARHYIHARTGKMQGDQYYWLLSDNPGERCRGATVNNLENFTASGYQTWKAWYDAYQRVFLYLPNSPVRSQGNRYLDLNRMQPRIERWERETRKSARLGNAKRKRAGNPPAPDHPAPRTTYAVPTVPEPESSLSTTPATTGASTSWSTGARARPLTWTTTTATRKTILIHQTSTKANSTNPNARRECPRSSSAMTATSHTRNHNQLTSRPTTASCGAAWEGGKIAGTVTKRASARGDGAHAKAKTARAIAEKALPQRPSSTTSQPWKPSRHTRWACASTMTISKSRKSV